MTSISVNRLFQRFDTNKSGGISHDEVKAFGKDAGVAKGFLGSTKNSKTADAVMDTLDANKSGEVTWNEFQAAGSSLLPGLDLKDASPASVGAKASEFFDTLDASGDGKATKAELTDAITKQLEAARQGMASTKGEIGAKMALHALDVNGDGKLGKQEVIGFAQDAFRALNPEPAVTTKPAATTKPATPAAAETKPATPAKPAVSAKPAAPTQTTPAQSGPAQTTPEPVTAKPQPKPATSAPAPQASVEGPSTASPVTPGNTAQAGAQKLVDLLMASPRLKTNQHLINAFYKQGGGTFEGASAAAAAHGVSMDDLLKDRGGSVGQVGQDALRAAKPELGTNQDMLNFLLDSGRAAWGKGADRADRFGLDINALTKDRGARVWG